MKTEQLRERLLSALLDVCWRQWTAIGVAGVRRSEAAAIDPEALAMITLVAGRHDARLFDEMLDWLVVNPGLVDIARFERMSKRFPEPQQRLARVVLTKLAESGRATLRQVAYGASVANEGAGSYSLEPLFLGEAGRKAVSWTGRDEDFARAGFDRGVIELRGMSMAPDAASPAAIRFRARALVGLGARAEVLTYLWKHDWAHGRRIAQASAYPQSSVADYLSSLAGAKLADQRVEGRKVLYRLSSSLADIGRSESRYVDWVLAFPAVAAVLGALTPVDAPDEVRWIRLETALREAASGLAAEGLDVIVP
ncbi:MAG: helix-turn-helix transcriptional regulator, partial [Coriobacteriia bacterium]|nr:helix-turn-helix transcriptional regulator [Coriobacteriia bacterium]